MKKTKLTVALILALVVSACDISWENGCCTITEPDYTTLAQQDAQQEADAMVEVCKNGVVYYATRAYGPFWAFTPKFEPNSTSPSTCETSD